MKTTKNRADFTALFLRENAGHKIDDVKAKKFSGQNLKQKSN